MYRPYDVDDNNFDYTISLEHLKDYLIKYEKANKDYTIEEWVEALDDISFIAEHKIYYYWNLKGMSDTDIKKRLAEDIAKCEVW